MGTKLTRALPAAMAGLLAVLLFAAGRAGDWSVWLVAIVLFGFSAAGTLVGLSLMRSHARIAMWLIDGWFIGILILNSALILGAAGLGVWISDRVLGQPATGDELAKTMGGLTGLVLGVFVTNVFADGDANSVWPSSIARRRASKVFKGSFATQRLKHDAVYEPRVSGTDPVSKKEIEFSGWGFIARHRRAHIIAR